MALIDMHVSFWKDLKDRVESIDARYYVDGRFCSAHCGESGVSSIAFSAHSIFLERGIRDPEYQVTPVNEIRPPGAVRYKASPDKGFIERLKLRLYSEEALQETREFLADPPLKLCIVEIARRRV